MKLRISGAWFLDEKKRHILLRGVNLGGSTKVPRYPDGATHLPTNYADHRTVSFVGRPFSLEDADEHYRRLRHWGFNCLRFLTTWEAIEHAGPGQYDEAYLDYLYEVVKKAGEYGFYVFIDPHQDVWSRMSGGDGAPGWTLELAGFDLAKLDASEAALTMAARYPDYPQMSWPSNGGRLASATLFTLFFAGNRFAPHTLMEGEPAQEFLQRHFIGAMQQVARRMADLPFVMGYDSLNEPSAGFIGVQRLSELSVIPPGAPMITPFEAMFIPAGFTHTSAAMVREGANLKGQVPVVMNPNRISCWRSSELDVWRAHGVWDVDEAGQPRLLRDDYFASTKFFADCMQPFIQRYGEAMRKYDSDAMIFIEGEPGLPEPMHAPHGLPVVNASHWYDEFTLFSKHYQRDFTTDWRTMQMVLGEGEVRKFFYEQIRRIQTMSRDLLGNVPTLIGEFGIPYDLDGGVAYRTGDFSAHVTALTTYYDILDELWLHSTQWNYTADNSNAWGDQWNQEDLSVFSRDQQTTPTDLDSGGRAVRGFCRPRLLACAGLPMEQSFNAGTGKFVLIIGAEPSIQGVTEVYLPRIHYPQGFKVQVSAGQTQYDSESQILSWQGLSLGVHTLTVVRK